MAIAVCFKSGRSPIDLLLAMNQDMTPEELERQLKECLREACRLSRQISKARKNNDLQRVEDLQCQQSTSINIAFELLLQSDYCWSPSQGESLQETGELQTISLQLLHRRFRQYPRTENVTDWINNLIGTNYTEIQNRDRINEDVGFRFATLKSQNQLWHPETCDEWYYDQICLRVKNRLCKTILEQSKNYPLEQLLNPQKVKEQINNLLQQFYDDLDRGLCILIRQSCESQNQRERSKLRNQIIIRMTNSSKIWKPPYSTKPELLQDYKDILQNRWLSFFEELHLYDPTQSGVMNHFNRSLKYRFNDVARIRSKIEVLFGGLSEDPEDPLNSQVLKAMSDLADRNDDSFSWEEMLDDIEAWAKENKAKELHASISNPPTNCQLLIFHVTQKLRSLHSEISSENQFWDFMAQQYDANPQALKNFWRSRCLPCISAFLDEQGWL